MEIPEMHLALHGLAIKKHGTAEAVASISGLELARVEALLEDAKSRGRVNEAAGKFMLAPTAQMALKGEYSRFYGQLRRDQDFIDAYEQFELINDQLKALITRWQTMTVGGEQVSNDHSDPEYDAGIINDLGDLHERIEPVIARFSKHVPRLRLYGEKLSAALDRVEDGEHRWVSDATIDSYHTVWFELHEDLLRITGRERSE